jgi:uncharacterized protein (TIGR01777 family)
MAKVLITGGTGLIGKALSKELLNNGHEVVHLSRTAEGLKNGISTYKWDINSMQIDLKAFEGIDSIIHLAGAGIADKPWSADRKVEIVESRVNSAKLLKQGCIDTNTKLKSYISASAIGWYPLIISEETFDETSPAGDGFLAEVCKQWEASSELFNDIAHQVARLRIGIVLAKDGGALPQMSLPVKLFVGAAVGHGTQAMPWIHLNDVSKMFLHVLENELTGTYNAVGPENATNEEFMQTIADVLEKPMLLPNVPEFVLKLIFGGKANLISKGVRVSSQKIKETGFSYEYPTLNTALSHLFLSKE